MQKLVNGFVFGSSNFICSTKSGIFLNPTPGAFSSTQDMRWVRTRLTVKTD